MGDQPIVLAANQLIQLGCGRVAAGAIRAALPYSPPPWGRRGGMNEGSGEFAIHDELDRFTGDRKVEAVIQSGSGLIPEIHLAVIVFGESRGAVSGQGSFSLLLSWDKDRDSAPLLSFDPDGGDVEPGPFPLSDWLADDRRVDLGSAFSWRSGDDSRSFVSIDCSASVLRVISNSRSVEYRIGLIEGRLSEESKARIKSVLDVTDGVPSSRDLTESVLKEIETIEIEAVSASMMWQWIGAALFILAVVVIVSAVK